MITIDDFRKAELRIGTVRSAERVEGSEKLLKLRVDIGSEERQIIAGIGKHYEPDTLVGRQIVIVANLEPRTLMGLESQGMLLAAGDGETISILVPEKPVLPGTDIR